MNPYREPGKPSSRLRQFFVDRTRVLWPTVVILAALSAMAATAALRINGVTFGANDNTVFVTADNSHAFVTVSGVIGDGVTDATAAFQAAAAKLVSGNTLVIPAGNFVLTDTITITKDNVRIVGAGVKSTIILFNPASAKAAIKVDNGGGVDRTYGGSIEGIYFKSGNTTQQKIAIDLVDTSGYVIKDVWVDPVTSATPPWRGSGSIGIRLRGRELTQIERVRLWADQPILVDVDPYIATPVSCDHLHVSDTYLLATPGGGNTDFKINDAIIVSNMTIDGDNAWIPDKYGFYWNNTGTETTNSWNIVIKGIRLEQFQDNTGWGFYIVRGKGLQNLLLEDIYQTSGANGVNLDGGLVSGISHVTLRHYFFTTTDGTKSDLTVANAVSDLLIDNVTWTAGATVTNNMTLAWAAAKKGSTDPAPPYAYYSDSTTYTARGGLQLSSTMYVGGVTSFVDTDAASANPYHFGTTNAWTGSSPLLQTDNNGTRKFYTDGNGNVWSKGGSYDTDGAAAMQVGQFNATSLALGKNGVSETLAGLLQTGLPAKANNTIASAATIAPTALITHITGTTSIVTMTAPTPFAQTNGGGCLILVFDGIAPWTAGGNIFVAGTPTTAGTNVQFCYDNATLKWYPSRTL